MIATTTTTMKISEIKIGTRHRKDLGDIAALAASIERLGLLHPIVVSPAYELIAGRRRLAAFEYLKRDAIPVTIASNLTELQRRIEAENEENICRKDLLPSEGYEIAQRVAKFYRPVAEAAAEDGRKSGAAKGGTTAGRGRPIASGKSLPKGKRDESKRTSAVAASAAGVSRPTFEKTAAVIESGDEKLIEEMDRTGRVAGVFKKLKVKQAVADIVAEPPPLPGGKFRVIVADPPWRYDNRAADPSHRNALPYPSMTVEEIAALPIADRATDDAMLWLWTTNSHLPEAWAIIEAWGFTYKTMLTWAKNRMGTGDWLRGQTEHCLLCVRGKPTINLTNQTTLLHATLRQHSKKPNEFYAMVEALCPGSKLELFQRTPREGWTGHGNEV